MAPSQSPVRVLIVDDNPAIHADFRKILGAPASGRQELDALAADLFGPVDAPPVVVQAMDLEVDSAHQGQEGLAMLEAALAEGRPYSLAFVDVRMPPGWDGIETIEHLWRADPRLQVVVCTAYSDYSWPQMLARLGTSDRLLILKKPFDTVEVSQLALALTQKWKSEEAGRNQVAALEAKVRARTEEVELTNDQLRREMARREQVEAELRIASRLETIGRLSAGLAHEINNPAQVVTHSVEFLGESFAALARLHTAYDAVVRAADRAGVAADERRALVELEARGRYGYLKREIPLASEQAMSGIGRISRVIGTLIDFAQGASHHKTDEDLNQAVRKTLEVCEGQWREVADLVLDLGTMPRVPCRVREIREVVLSLVTNAAQAMAATAHDGRRGTLRIRTSIDGPSAILQVSDTGTGIPAAIRERVFDPFFTTRDVGEGSGQGLAVARAIVVAGHGGTIQLESAVGQGTTFTVRLPLLDPLAQAA